MLSGLQSEKDPDQVATQIFEDLHRGLVQALETKQQLDRASVHFPFTQETLQTLFYLASRDYSLPVSYTWGREGPYFHRPEGDRIGPTQTDFREITSEWRTHYVVMSSDWTRRFDRPPRPIGWFRTGELEESRPIVDSSRYDSRSELTPSFDALEKFFIKKLDDLTDDLSSTQSVDESGVIERTQRIQWLEEYFPAETGQLYTAALELLNLFAEIRMAMQADGYTDYCCLVDEPPPTPRRTRTSLPDRRPEFISRSNTLLHQSARSKFLVNSQLDNVALTEAGTNDDENAVEIVNEMVDYLADFFSVAKDAYSFIVTEQAPVSVKVEIIQILERFYAQRAWPVIANSIGAVEAKGPRGQDLADRALEDLSSYYDSFKRDLFSELKEIRRLKASA